MSDFFVEDSSRRSHFVFEDAKERMQVYRSKRQDRQNHARLTFPELTNLVGFCWVLFLGSNPSVQTQPAPAWTTVTLLFTSLTSEISNREAFGLFFRVFLRMNGTLPRNHIGWNSSQIHRHCSLSRCAWIPCGSSLSASSETPMVSGTQWGAKMGEANSFGPFEL